MEPKPRAAKRIPALHLANLTAALAGHQLQRAPMANSVAVNLAGCRMPITEARLLWYACEDRLKRTPKGECAGLKIEDLAMLAASLSHGATMREIDRRIVAQEALRLWQMCNPREASPKSRTAFVNEEMEVLQKAASNLPKKFRVTLREALRKFQWATKMPSVKKREKLFKLYLRDAHARADFARLKKCGLTKDEFFLHAAKLPRWSKDYSDQLKKERNLKGGYGNKFDAIRAKANLGDADSQYKLGTLYADGKFDDGFPWKKNYSMAAKWLEKSGDQGNWLAQRRLAILYGLGLGVKMNKAKAKALFIKARVGWEAQHRKDQDNADKEYSQALEECGVRDSKKIVLT